MATASSSGEKLGGFKASIPCLGGGGEGREGESITSKRVLRDGLPRAHSLIDDDDDESWFTYVTVVTRRGGGGMWRQI